MLEAGQFDELIELALRGRALPDDDELTRRDDEYQRLQFRLKAALRLVASSTRMDWKRDKPATLQR